MSFFALVLGCGTLHNNSIDVRAFAFLPHHPALAFALCTQARQRNRGLGNLDVGPVRAEIDKHIATNIGVRPVSQNKRKGSISNCICSAWR
jgi:hypothetical protein